MQHHRLYKFLFIACFAAGFLTIASCKKDSNTGVPVITRLRAVSPAPNDSVLTKAGPGQTVVIQGSNLGSTLQVYFNGYPSPFNSALLADDNIVVTIPADMPFASLDQAQLNKVKVVTTNGEVTFEFPIVPPPPVVSAASNEYAMAGDHLILTGNNFFFVDKVIFPGNIEVATNIVTNATGTSLEVTVPAGITAAGPLKVKNRYGLGTSLLLFNDFVTGVLCNFDNINTLNNWAGASIKTAAATEFPGNTGGYANLKYGSIPANDFVWYGGGRSLNVEIKGPWVPVANISDPLDNYAVKFEVNAKSAWKGGSLFIVRDYTWDFLARYEPWIGNPEFKTNGWQTVVIPLSMFKSKANGQDGTGSPAASITALLGGGSGMAGINIFVINAQNAVLPSFDIAVDNFRVAKIK
jgi:Surface glycan-binding protein B xyloglucan binding domain/IPT/TIG domain